MPSPMKAHIETIKFNMWYSKVTPAIIAGRVNAPNTGLISNSEDSIALPNQTVVEGTATKNDAKPD